MPDKEQPMTPWRECKAIAEALYPKREPRSLELITDDLRGFVLSQLAATGPKGAALAERLATAAGPIAVSTDELPECLQSANATAIAISSFPQPK